ncbi:NS31 [American grass carp reovirus]|uniref:Non-structural protein 4 n=1 Tax=Aquareovirus G (isolate American grass carp/USA/PB01-155/-) TaxID=648234 RepID=VNS4_AQRVG|nr:NS31 [American grass carp reovirus]B2BNE6.1 RecName: Full=Non-structural protein 4; Short=NS4; AltName: Full=NS31 [American grass carp reovirus PB01-155]ABV01046.1 NS31 [American grass carp reovirus]
MSAITPSSEVAAGITTPDFPRDIRPRSIREMHVPPSDPVPDVPIPTNTTGKPVYYIYDGSITRASGQLVRDHSCDGPIHYTDPLWECTLFEHLPPSHPGWPNDCVLPYDHNMSPYHRVPIRTICGFNYWETDRLDSTNASFWPALYKCSGFRRNYPWRYSTDQLLAALDMTPEQLVSAKSCVSVVALLNTMNWTSHHLSGLRPQHVHYCMSDWSVQFTKEDLEVLTPGAWFDGLLRVPVDPRVPAIGLTKEQLWTHPFVILGWLRLALQ